MGLFLSLATKGPLFTSEILVKVFLFFFLMTVIGIIVEIRSPRWRMKGFYLGSFIASTLMLFVVVTKKIFDMLRVLAYNNPTIIEMKTFKDSILELSLKGFGLITILAMVAFFTYIFKTKKKEKTG